VGADRAAESIRAVLRALETGQSTESSELV